MRDLEASLLAEWGKDNESFVSDGVTNWEHYIASSPKVLFVLKEVNDLGGGGWDLREFLRTGGRAQTWNNITRWVEGIRAIESDLDWSTLEAINEERRKEALLSIAALNLKKTPGSHTSNWREVTTMATQDRQFLKRQVEIYDADLIVCCGVGDTFRLLVDSEHPNDWTRTRRGIYFYQRAAGKYVIAYSHPEARVSDCLLYYGLVDAVREILTPRSAG